MIFESHSLDEPLNRFIEAVFHFRDFHPDHGIERVVPTGHSFLLFELDGMTRHTYDDERKPLGTFERAWVSGVHRNYISISAHAASEMFVVQFKAHGSVPFLHRPASELADRVIPGEKVLDGDLLPLRERLLAAEAPADKFAIADGWLRERYREHLAPPPELTDVIESLERRPASQRVEACARYPHSQKHLIEQFHRFVGLTPKIYQRILRFNEVFRVLQAGEAVRWAAVAAHCGFSDQPHFIREFKRFSGFNPSEFLREEFEEGATNFFPLDRR